MQNPFSSITTAGLLLPLDLLTRVGSMDRALPGMTPADYHVAGSVRLNEAATAAYSRALAYWKSFRKKFDALPASDTGTTLTRDEWLLPLFDCLGYGRLQNKRAITIDNKDYPISHGWEDHVPIHLLSARLPLDKRTQNVSGAATRSPYSLVQELLNRSSKHRWGFVSNGLKLYVLRDNASLTRSANVEFDLESMMDGEYHADFTVLFLICHQSRLEIRPTPIVDNKSSIKKAAKPAKAKKSASKVAEKPSPYKVAGVARLQFDSEDIDDESELLRVQLPDDELDGDEEAIEIEEPTRLGPENCWLEAWTKLAGEQGTRAKERLRDGVQLAIQTFGAGFYTCSCNVVLHERLRSGELSTQDYYRQLLRLVYRLLMLMVAEDKRTESGQNLLHPIDTPAHIRDRYNQFYSVGRIRKLANERRGTPHRDLYESLKTTFLKLRDGYAPLGIPGIGSFLFSDTATPDLDSAQITNEALLDAFRNLCFTEDATGRGGSIRRAVDFGNLGSEELGSIYESLLELHPEIDSQDGPFVLRTAAGNERKTSGSYYTPTSLINCLLDSALDPVVNQAIDVPDREEAKRRLLDLKVCDPACGSGHFLIAAANRMALHLARLETQDTEPTTLQIQHAKRQIIGRCIYGVDINEMAVELCKVSLWMEALEPGKPFSFLENHIKCGNSLLGATPRLLLQGIPDDAFNPIEGDNKEICSQLKKQNKRERIDHKSGQRSLFEPFYKLGNMADRFAKLSAAEDDSLDAIADKQKLYEELVKGTPYLNARFWADTWCSAFVWKKDDTDPGRLCPTERKFREIERSPHAASQMIRDEIKRIAEQYQFFHWHLVFPDVFVLPEAETTAENEQAGWNGGFDVVLGNPPWDRLKLDTTEWFAFRHRDIAQESDSDKRRFLIEELAKTDTSLNEEFRSALIQFEATSKMLRSSGFLLYGTGGEADLSTAFADLDTILINKHGRVGVITSGTTITGKSAIPLVDFWTGSKRLKQAWEFTNGCIPNLRHIFPCDFLIFGSSCLFASTFKFIGFGIHRQS
ncbi:Eco57I restriction-modification methylase domain-containing protein [Pirellulaceae bacterium SH449]